MPRFWCLFLILRRFGRVDLNLCLKFFAVLQKFSANIPLLIALAPSSLFFNMFAQTFVLGSTRSEHTSQYFLSFYSFYALAWICDIILPSSFLIVSFIVSSALKFIYEFLISTYVRISLVKLSHHLIYFLEYINLF